MATFKVEVLPLVIESHPDPATTALEIGKVGDYNIVVKKGQFKTGDLAAYIPESAIVPDSLLIELGLTGRLAGSAKNRVKAIKLRGIMSQGIAYSAKPEWTVGQDVTELLGITKYEPVIPPHLMGEMNSHKSLDPKKEGLSFSFDIENIKKWNEIFQEGEEVVFTEKIHGTFVCLGLAGQEDQREDMINGKFFISSKGLAKTGIYFKDSDANKDNTYIKTIKSHDLLWKLDSIKNGFLSRPCRQWRPLMDGAPIWLCGEVLGIQKGYGYGATGDKTGFRAFGIKIGKEWLDRDGFNVLCDTFEIPRVPELYRGPFSKDKLKEFTSGKESITGNKSHIREGLVVNPIIERRDPNLGRVILKSVSDEYLDKSDGEEIA